MPVKIGAFATGATGVLAAGAVALALLANAAWVMFLLAAVGLVVLGRFVR